MQRSAGPTRAPIAHGSMIIYRGCDVVLHLPGSPPRVSRRLCHKVNISGHADMRGINSQDSAASAAFPAQKLRYVASSWKPKAKARMSGLLPIADVVAKNREHLLGQQLQLEQQQFERLKHDFSYNLSLLRERDTELERYDMEAAALRGQLDQRDAALQEAQRAIEELETQAATAASKASAMLATIAEADKQARDHREREQRRTAELQRVEQELEETRRQRDEARKEATRASNAGAEAKQEAISVRNELGMRLHAAQQELAEAEEGCRRAVQEERAQLEARLKATRSEQQRHTASLQEQVERLHAELAEAGRAHDMNPNPSPSPNPDPNPDPDPDPNPDPNPNPNPNHNHNPDPNPNPNPNPNQVGRTRRRTRRCRRCATRTRTRRCSGSGRRQSCSARRRRPRRSSRSCSGWARSSSSPSWRPARSRRSCLGLGLGLDEP